MTTLDTASAVAAAICWLARWRGQGSEYVQVRHRHPRECDWCVYPATQLIAWVEEFNEADLIAGSNPEHASTHRIAGTFMRQSNERQRQQVDAALYPDPVPA